MTAVTFSARRKPLDGLEKIHGTTPAVGA